MNWEELEEAVMAEFKVLSQNVPRWIGKNHKKPQDIWPLGRNLNPEPPEYKARMLTIQL
jgi:hypothetical protein